MSMTGDIVRSILDKAVKYDMPPSDTASFINDIFQTLQWDSCCNYTIEDVIKSAKFSATDKYSLCDKDAYNKWINKYQ
jgi:hypothetical protein